MDLSIIVPVYNMAADERLAYCMESLAAQTLTEFEVIAVDDASTDKSLEILREYEARYPKIIKVLALPENHRQGGAKNRALEICAGDYIGFIDADDWAAPDMYEKLLKKAKETQADIVCCHHVITKEHNYEKEKIQKDLSEDLFGTITDDKFRKLINHTGHMVTKIYAKHIFFDPILRFPERMFYEDNAIGLEVLRRAGKIEGVEEALYYYYQHEDSTVHIVTKERCENRMEAMRIMLRLAKEGNYLEPFYPEIEYKFINLFYQNTLFSYMQGKNRKNIVFLKRLAAEMKDTFPDFQKNLIYISEVNPEERKLMRLQQRSTLLFLIYYRALWFYRHIRYGKK